MKLYCLSYTPQPKTETTTKKLKATTTISWPLITWSPADITFRVRLPVDRELQFRQVIPACLSEKLAFECAVCFNKLIRPKWPCTILVYKKIPRWYSVLLASFACRAINFNGHVCIGTDRYIFIYPHLSLIHHANSCLTVMQKRKEMAGSPINFCFNKTSKLLSKPSTFAVG